MPLALRDRQVVSTPAEGRAPPVHAAVLAAGQGTRMRSAIPKVLHEVAGRPMLGRVLDTALQSGVSAVHVVLGYQAPTIREWLAAEGCPATQVDTVLQTEQLGTAHAVEQVLPRVPDDALVVVLYGDVPLVEPQLVRDLCGAARDGLALVTTHAVDPTGYGRIVRDHAGVLTAVVEESEAGPAQRAITEINTGLLAAPRRRLAEWLARVGRNNAKGEYYLTDVVALAVADGIPVRTIEATDPAQVAGVNDAVQLAAAERHFQMRQATALMAQGLWLADPARFDLRGKLQFGQDVHVDVGCVFEGHVELGDDLVIGPYCILRNASVASGSRLASHSVVEQAQVGPGCRIGPFSRLRPGARLARGVHVGNFVEVKNSRLGEQTKANHLAYVGDAELGARVNVGAGVITCNYDGANKHHTVVGDDVFIGTDSQLVAPVMVGAGAFIAAGSTIAHDVPAGGLTICRAREQKTYSDWTRPAKKK